MGADVFTAVSTANAPSAKHSSARVCQRWVCDGHRGGLPRLCGVALKPRDYSRVPPPHRRCRQRDAVAARDRWRAPGGAVRPLSASTPTPTTTREARGTRASLGRAPGHVGVCAHTFVALLRTCLPKCERRRRRAMPEHAHPSMHRHRYASWRPARGVTRARKRRRRAHSS